MRFLLLRLNRYGWLLVTQASLLGLAIQGPLHVHLYDICLFDSHASIPFAHSYLDVPPPGM